MAIINRSIIIGKVQSAEGFYPHNRYALRSVKEVADYIDGKRTGTLKGFAYECADMDSLDHVVVRIEGQKKPLISDEELQSLRNNGEKIIVSFDNLTVRTYINYTQNIVADIFNATDIKYAED